MLASAPFAAVMRPWYALLHSPHWCELCADFYLTVNAALRHESTDLEEDREGLECHLGQGLRRTLQLHFTRHDSYERGICTVLANCMLCNDCHYSLICVLFYSLIYNFITTYFFNSCSVWYKENWNGIGLTSLSHSTRIQMFSFLPYLLHLVAKLLGYSLCIA